MLWICIIVVFIYAGFSATVLGPNFPTDTCGYIFECFAQLLAYGFASSYNTAIPTIYSDDVQQWGYSILAVTFYVLLTLIVLNAVTGLVVNAFSDQRAKAEAAKEAKDNYCFICSKHRKEFQNVRGGFDRHNSKHHSIWNYLMLLIHLNNMNESDYNFIESFVYARLVENSLTWFPIDKAISLNVEVVEEKVDTGIDLESLKSFLAAKIDEKFQEFSEKEREVDLVE